MRLVRVACALSLLLGGAAGAGTIVTPPLSREDGLVALCMVVNAGTKAIGPLTVAIMQSDGTPAGAVDEHPSIEPGHTVSKANSVGDSHVVYCRVEGRVSPKKVRVSFCVHPVDDLTCLTSVSVP